MKELAPSTTFDYQQKVKLVERESFTERMGAVCLSLADLCIRYAGVERIPRYHENHRENDAEHSSMVAILSVELANELRPELDRGLLSQFANIHDFVEIAVGDTPTYNLTELQLHNKHALEQEALQSLIQTMPPYTANLLLQYEEQLLPEARFVRAVDKLTPLLVDILGPGEMVMREDYGVTDVVDLMRNQDRLNDSMRRRFGEDTPEIVNLYEYLGDLFNVAYQEKVS